MTELELQIEEASSMFENYEVRDDNKSFMLAGILNINKNILDEHILETYELEIIIPKNFPKELPKIYEKSSKIKTHINGNGTLCLGTELELRLKLEEGTTIIEWIDKCVIPYLCVSEYYKKYKVYPYGEWSHNNDGIIEFYKKLFEVEKKTIIKEFLKVIIKGRYSGHILCPCGSKKKIRDCHKELIFKLLKRDDFKSTLENDYKEVFK